jgi:hypothetical protein
MFFKQQGEFVAKTKKNRLAVFSALEKQTGTDAVHNRTIKNRSYMMDLRLRASPRHGGHSAV